ncbi:MAG TPA: pilus assembly protein PilM [Vicinamibacterales bacterium]|nr:pilus assembly protein PilM [Vicinamibacterales bacterium]
MSLLATWLASPPLDAAIEIAPEAVSIAVLGGRGQNAVVQGYAVEPLPVGAVVPSLLSANLPDRDAVVRALRAACESVGVRPRRVALVIPDLAAKVSLVRFDKTPARRDDLDQLIRWQIKKSTPFPIEDASLTSSLGSRGPEGSEFVVVAARRETIREYESVCEEAGIEAGLVDLSTLAVVNLFLSSGPAATGDWLLVHMRPEYTSIVILRGEDVIFFRNRAEDDEEDLQDVVHQTAMYYQDRLSGRGFARILLGGLGRTPGAVDLARRTLEERMEASVEPIDPTQGAALTDRIHPTPELMATLSPLVGMLLRTRREAVAV